MADRCIASTRRAVGWPIVALLLAVMLVGHDLLMTSPVAHAAPDAMVPSHHQGQDQPAGAMTMSSPNILASEAQNGSPCPANRVAKAQSPILIDAAPEAANTVFTTDGRSDYLNKVAVAREELPLLPATTRRALLQVFLM